MGNHITKEVKTREEGALAYASALVQGEEAEKVSCVSFNETPAIIDLEPIESPPLYPEPKTKHSRHDFMTYYGAQSIISLGEITWMFLRWKVNHSCPQNVLRQLWSHYYSGRSPKWFDKVVRDLKRYYAEDA